MGDLLSHFAHRLWAHHHQTHPVPFDFDHLSTRLQAHSKWFGIDGLLLLLESDFFGNDRHIALVGIDTKNVPLASQFDQSPHTAWCIGHLFYLQIISCVAKFKKNRSPAGNAIK